MSKIRVLPEHLSNRIAAGEVVERPASVVKELLENSLDAGADRIEVEIEGGGTRLIRIIDNGEGMDEDDILLCLERHGTSKITDDHDLDSISTLGFRGEALPSIGSVAKLVIVSRPAGRELGSRVVADFGRLIKVHETGCPCGTVIEVGSLFGNTPARRKFLRTLKTEIGHVEEVVKNYALAVPAVTFIVRIDGREALHLDGADTIESRLARIMRYKGPFMEVDSRPVRQDRPFVHGLLVPPEATISAAAILRLFVNGRTIKDKMMIHAAAEGLRGFLMKGGGPAGFLHLRLPPDEVDVNVHPAKHEVRFRNSHEIHELIRQAVQQAVQGLQKSIKTEIFSMPVKTALSVPPEPEMRPAVTGLPRTVDAAGGPQPLPYPAPIPPGTGYTAPEAFAGAGDFAAASPLQAAEPAPEEQSPLPAPNSPSGERHGLSVIGQFSDLYIFCQSGDRLVVIDQHAAHERLLFERLRRQFLQGRVTSQSLLFPVTVELSLLQSRLVEKNIREIERLGFSVREFGGNTHIISAVPALAGQCDSARLFMDMLERFGSDTSRTAGAGRLEDILADMACKAAVRSGDRLTAAEIDALLSQMARADLFSHCPHGRPVLKYFQAEEIKKWFYRP
ncbi:MAG: DNA mismatch repair endonuclease MutL [Desulfocapsaceae bacterium]|nr:DNA mismatch repair endonuclease MutL [Desulfocapsaceae bacterium]